MINVNSSIITSAQNARVKQWASLLDKKNRDRSGMFIVEGVHLVLEALKSGAHVETIVYDMDRGIPIELNNASSHAEWVGTNSSILAKCTGTDTAPPVFAVVEKRQGDPSSLYLSNGLVVVLDGVRDPGNAGTIIRSADAVGANAVIIGKGSVDLYNPKTVRSTMGSLFHIPIIEAELSDLLPEAAAHGAALVATSLQATDTCYSYDWTGLTWMLMGNESDGLSSQVLKAATHQVIIPMHGQSESLNVAMAATVMLYEALRQRRYANQ